MKKIKSIAVILLISVLFLIHKGFTAPGESRTVDTGDYLSPQNLLENLILPNPF